MPTLTIHAATYTIEPFANLLGANLLGANLLGADLRGANLSDANLRGADLRGANLLGADLRGADLRGANLSDADLRGANLSDADLSDADLSDADLRGADLSGADLRGDKISSLLTVVKRQNDPYDFIAFRLEDGSVKILAGCRWFTVDAYREHVAAEYPITDKATETLQILDFIQLRAAS